MSSASESPRTSLPVVDHVKAPYTTADYGLSLLRITLCALFVFHGVPKLMNLDATADFMASKQIPMPWFSALAVGLCETLGGLLVLVGFKTRLAATLLAFTMLVACSVHWPVFDNRAGGFEYPLTLALVSASLALIGPGRLSFDACHCNDAGGPVTYIKS